MVNLTTAGDYRFVAFYQGFEIPCEVCLIRVVPGALDISKSVMTGFWVNNPSDFMLSLSYSLDNSWVPLFKYWLWDSYKNVLPNTNITLNGTLNGDAAFATLT